MKYKKRISNVIVNYLDQTYPSKLTEDMKPKYDTDEDMYHAKSKKAKLFNDDPDGITLIKTHSRNEEMKK